RGPGRGGGGGVAREGRRSAGAAGGRRGAGRGRAGRGPGRRRLRDEQGRGGTDLVTVRNLAGGAARAAAAGALLVGRPGRARAGRQPPAVHRLVRAAGSRSGSVANAATPS